MGGAWGLRVLDIAVFMWLLHFSMLLLGPLMGFDVSGELPELVPAWVGREGVFNLELLIGKFVALTALGGLAGLSLLIITERSAMFIVGLLMFVGVGLTLDFLANVIPPVFNIGHTINSLVVMALGLQLPPLFVAGVNTFMYFLTFLAVVDVISGRRLRDFGA